MGDRGLFRAQRCGLRWAMVVTSCAPGLLSLSLTLGFIQSSAVPAGLGHAPHPLDAIDHLQQEGDYLQNRPAHVIKQTLIRLTVYHSKCPKNQ